MIGDWRYRTSGTSLGAVRQAVLATVGSIVVTPGVVAMVPSLPTLVPIRLVVITTGTISVGTSATLFDSLPKGLRPTMTPVYSLWSRVDCTEKVHSGSIGLPGTCARAPGGAFLTVV